MTFTFQEHGNGTVYKENSKSKMRCQRNLIPNVMSNNKIRTGGTSAPGKTLNKEILKPQTGMVILLIYVALAFLTF